MTLKKQNLLKVINPIIGILMLIQAGSGIFHQSIPYEIFEKVHGSAGLLLAAGVMIHIILNWSWFRTAFSKRKQSG